MASILIVDDNPNNVDLIRDSLIFDNYNIQDVRSGQAALDFVDQQHPDLILLDVNMPGLNGFDVCRILKGSPHTASIPIIMLTAQSDVESRVEGLDSGADDYLTKPFSPRELRARVERTLRSKDASDHLRQAQDDLIKTFSRFVAAPIVKQLMENPQHVKLGGQLQPVTVLFADLQGFTGLSERTSPEELLQVLNQYHTFMTKLILQYGGTIDKFLGDGVMALYNTPIPQEDHIARAVKSALHIQDSLHWFIQKLPAAHQMKINFGIHSGMAIVGNVGSENIMDFTAVGDTVNVAARLQGIADEGAIMVSHTVFEETQDFIFGRSRGEVLVKGRQLPIRVYQISNTYFD